MVAELGHALLGAADFYRPSGKLPGLGAAEVKAACNDWKALLKLLEGAANWTDEVGLADRVGERVAQHFLAVFGRFPFVDVPDAVHDKLRIVGSNLAKAREAQQEVVEQPVAADDAPKAPAAKIAKLDVSILWKIRETGDPKALERQRWCIQGGISLDPDVTSSQAVAAPLVPAGAAAASAAFKPEPVFLSLEQLLEFLRACVACHPRRVFLKWTSE